MNELDALNDHANDCEHLAEWISAAVDQELSADEARLLQQHLNSCPGCRKRRATYEQLNLLAASPQISWMGVGALTAERPAKKPLAERRRSASRWWLGALSVAALVMITLTVSVWMRPGPSADDPLREPLARLDVINLQSDRDRQEMLKTMHLDLRAMMLEVDHAQLEPKQMEQMKEKINQLMQRVQSAGP